MMPHGGPGNQWGPQWYPPAGQFGQHQAQGMMDMTAYQMVGQQQHPNQYGAGGFPPNQAWNNGASQQWMQQQQQWQQNMPMNTWGSNLVPASAQPPPPPPPANPPPTVQQIPPPPPEPVTHNQQVVPTVTEKEYDAQFKEWENKFLAWKEENKNHPDKKALAEYEAQWQSWRDQLVQNREQMRRQQQELQQRQQQELQQKQPIPQAVQPVSRPIIQPVSQQQLPVLTNQAVHGQFPQQQGPYSNLQPQRPANQQMDYRNQSMPQDRPMPHPGYQNEGFQRNAGSWAPPEDPYQAKGFQQSPQKRFGHPNGREGWQQPDQPFQNNYGPPRDIPHGIRPLLDPSEFVQPVIPDMEPLAASGESAANLFRKRALLKKEAAPRLMPYGRPVSPVNRAPESRPRIEERLAVVADIKLTNIPRKEEVVAPSIPIGRLEPIVFEYNHRPGRNGRFADEPVSIDYSHGRRLEPPGRIIEARDIPPLQPVIPELKPIEIAKPAPSVLFPSAAAIQEKVQPQLPPKIINEVGVAALKLAEPPRNDTIQVEPEVILVEDLLLPPGRYGRPSKVVVILRGLPGSGKSHVARLIKEKEVAMGGSAPRILAIDDYYLIEDAGSPVPWEENLEEQYRQNLLKSLKRNLDDGHFPFIIVDALHVRANEIIDVLGMARSRAFSVFLVDLPLKERTGTTRKISETDLEKMKKDWQLAPHDVPRLDIRWLFQETVDGSIPTPENVVSSTTVVFDEDSQTSSNETPAVSKWEYMEQTEEKLDRLDGIIKRKSEKPASMEDWLQSGLPDDYEERKCVDGKKRVRWADVEEKNQQKKMRDMGFVIGQTDWSRMTDPTFGESALTKTKYI